MAKNPVKALKRITETLVCYMEDNGDAELYSDEDFKTIKNALEKPIEAIEAYLKWYDDNNALDSGEEILVHNFTEIVKQYKEIN